MTQAPVHTTANPSRLVRFLTDLSLADVTVSHKHFAERLGQLFDLPDSIRIATAQGGSPAATFAPNGASVKVTREEFMRVRTAIMRSAIRSFDPGSTHVRIRFPVSGAGVEQSMAAEPYLAFYAAQQRDIDFRIRNLQAGIRESVAGISPGLASLAALDAALGEPLAVRSRSFFATVPRLLGKRFGHLLDQYREQTAGREHDDDLWAKTLDDFRSEMQALLLAEIETRLLPVLGLIEAIDEQEDR